MNRLLLLALAGWAAFAHAQEPAAVPYPGAEQDAEWRREAEERIDEIRRAQLEVLVEDAGAHPIKGAVVHVRQQQHGFPFSTHVDPRLFDESDAFSKEDRARYRQTVLELFSILRPRPDATDEEVEAIRAWAVSHAIQLGEVPAESTAGFAPARFDSDSLIPPADLIEALNNLAAAHEEILALPYRFETDGEGPDERELQARYTADYLTLMFSRPEVTEIGFAGIWEPTIAGKKWALFDPDWTPRAVADSYRNLVRKKWWTDETVLTDATGRATIPAFLGAYRISASVGARTRTVNATLEAEGAAVTIQMEEQRTPETDAESE